MERKVSCRVSLIQILIPGNPLPWVLFKQPGLPLSWVQHSDNLIEIIYVKNQLNAWNTVSFQ